MSYPEYFEKIARELKDIGHSDARIRFSRLDFGQETVEPRTKLDPTDFCLFVGFPEATIADQRADNPHFYQTVVMMVVKNAPDSKNYSAVNAIQEQAFDIAMQIFARIYEDKCQGIIQGFDRNSIRSRELYQEPHKASCGHEFTFTLHRSLAKQMFYDSTRWQ